MSFYLFELTNLGIMAQFHQSNTAGQVIVVSLIVFSVIAWTVMFAKMIELRSCHRLNREFARRMRDSESLLGLRFGANVDAMGPFARCVSDAVAAAGLRGANEGSSRRIRMAHIENAIQRAVADQTVRYENRMVMLGSIVTGAPFLGLLGTVWGVMDAFGALAGQSTATIQNLAPGVSGALLTTVMGLIVAIPSVFGYNFLLSFARRLITELENFASSLADRIELEVEASEAPHCD